MKIRLAAIRLIATPVLFFASFNVSAQQSDSVSLLIGNNQLSVSKINLQSLPSHKNYLSPKALVIPTTMIVYGFASLNSVELQKLNKNICEEVVEDAGGFKTKADDYLKYAPTASVYLLNFVGVKGRHGFVDRSVILVASTILSSQLVTALKHSTHQLRPDGSTYNSFPSGHTTTAFIGAELMNQEFGWRSPWYSVAGYSLATGTALLRIMNNRHWLSDVIAGAGIGMLTTKFTYWVYSKWENRKRAKPVLYY